MSSNSFISLHSLNIIFQKNKRNKHCTDFNYKQLIIPIILGFEFSSIYEATGQMENSKFKNDPAFYVNKIITPGLMLTLMEMDPCQPLETVLPIGKFPRDTSTQHDVHFQHHAIQS